MIKKDIYEALLAKYKAEEQVELINLQSLVDNPQSIPEHSDLVGEADQLIDKITTLRDKAATAKSLIDDRV